MTSTPDNTTPLPEKDSTPKDIALSVQFLKPIFENMPGELKAQRIWTLWRGVPRTQRDGSIKITKPPLQPSGEDAKSNDPNTWSSFEEVKQAYEKGGYDGIGIMTTKPYVSYDQDDCVNADFELSESAKDDLNDLNSYCEFSPSGRGIRAFIKGKKPGSNCKRGNFEMYDHARFMTVTGQHIDDYPLNIRENQDGINAVYARRFSSSQGGEKRPEPRAHKKTDLTDNEIVEKANKASNGDTFSRLYAGQDLDYPSPSEGDQAFCDILAFYTKDQAQIKRIWENSGRYRDKIRDRPELMDRAVSNALARVKEEYGTGKKSSQKRKEEKEKSVPIEVIDPEPCDLAELLKVFRKWLYIEEDYTIVAPTCAVIANFCPGDPDIIGIIGPSGSSKTEFIRSLGVKENHFIYPISSITEHAFVSGHKDSMDLVPRLKGRLVCIKDLTSLLSKKEDIRAQIFADFRELTDGYIKKVFGNGITKEYYDIHSSILFASTNAIERYYSMYSNLGQRMLFIRPKTDPKKARRKAAVNRDKLEPMRAELHSIMMRFIKSTIERIGANGLPEIDEELSEELGLLCDFLARARTQIHHDFKGEIDEIPEPEFPTRLINTISRLCQVHALINGREETTRQDLQLGIRLVLDNIPTVRWQILNAMSEEWATTSSIAKEAGLPTSPTKRVLDELFALGVLDKKTREEKIGHEDGRSDSYKISGEVLPVVDQLKGVIRGGCIQAHSFTSQDE